MCISFAYNCRKCHETGFVSIWFPSLDGPQVSPNQPFICEHFDISRFFEFVTEKINHLQDSSQAICCDRSKDLSSNHALVMICLDDF